LVLSVQANVGARGEAMYDSRLFNQDTGGTGSGLASEDAYNMYDKPMWADRGSGLYRPTVQQVGLSVCRLSVCCAT
jgi:hypothetical protein